MYISKELREKVYNKFDGLCAYSGTPLEDDWQVNRIVPVHLIKKRNKFKDGSVIKEKANDIANLMPVQKIINHYKGGLPLEKFKSWYLGGLHKRLAKLPTNPKSYYTITRKKYMLEVAEYFGITPDKPFCGKLYFEKINKE